MRHDQFEKNFFFCEIFGQFATLEPVKLKEKFVQSAVSGWAAGGAGVHPPP